MDSSEPWEPWEAVEGQWLAAGRASDASTMRQLQVQHPRRLALDRVFGDGWGGRTGNWSGFPLATLGASAIHAAAWNRSLDVIRFLLEGGQQPDARDDGQLTPLMATVMRHGLPLTRSVFVGREAVPRHLAVDCREEVEQLMMTSLAIVRLLIEFGTDINAQNHEGRTALMLVAHDDVLEIAELLLQEGAAIDARDQEGWTALRHSIEGHSLFVINLLLTRGANIDLPDLAGTSPLQAAIQQQSINQLQIFINHYALSVRPQRLDFAGFVLFEAVKADAHEIVEWLLQDGSFVTIRFRNEHGENVFHHAHSSRMIEFLLELDGDRVVFRSRTARGESCFHSAARRQGESGYSALVGLLNEFDRAAQTGEVGNIMELLGANSEGATPLFQAATHPNDSLEASAAKCDALMARDAPLLPPTELPWNFLFDSTGRTSAVVMSDRLQVCLSRWLTFATSNGEEALTDVDRDLSGLLLRWIVCVDFDHDRRRAVISSEAVATMMHAAFIHDLVPLLLALPLRADSIETFLAALDRFVAHSQPGQALFLQRLVLLMSVARATSS